MTLKIGINGFGRIGKLTLRAINQRYRNKLEVVAVNNWSDARINAHLVKWDSTYGRYQGKVEPDGDSIIVDGKRIKIFNEAEPSTLHWGEYGVDIVIESSGRFTDAHDSHVHIENGVKKVLISAPSVNEDIMLVYGVNHESYDPEKHHVLSNASCTTNCVTPVAKVLQNSFGIEKALMTTVHAVTSDQRLLDGRHDDLRRGRTAVNNIILTTTGAARAVTNVIPELEGKIHGIALRVPVATVSVVDLVATLERDVTVDEVISQ